MAIGPFLREGKQWLAGPATLVVLLGSGLPAAAQGPGGGASAPLAVSATVVQTCTVEEVNVPALPDAASPAGRTSNAPGPSYSIRCGKQRLTYPAPAGSRAASLTKGAPVTVSRTADGRTVVVQF